jgi:hypothetical protein
MVTKRTGRPCGRPGKPVSDKIKLSPGRPPKALATDPDRYFLAIIQANIDAAEPHGISERHVCETYAGLKFGRPIRSQENMRALALGHPFHVEFNRERHRLRGWVGASGEQGAGWLNRNAFRPYADGLRAKLRKIRQNPPSDPDRRWLAAMSSSWSICFKGNLRLKGHAEALAALVGEMVYFRERMQPTLFDSFCRGNSRGGTTIFAMPDF